MTFDEYSDLALKTAKNVGLANDLIHAALGLTSEAGEVATSVKAHIIYGKPLDIENIKEELGDILWFVNYMAGVLNVSLESVAIDNIAKLRRRYPDGRFDELAALQRLDKIEPTASLVASDPEDWMV